MSTLSQLLRQVRDADEVAGAAVLRVCGGKDRPLHAQRKTLQAAFIGYVPCPECGPDPATIVDGQALGLLEQPARAKTPGRSADRPARAYKPTKAELEAQVRQLKAEVARLRRG